MTKEEIISKYTKDLIQLTDPMKLKNFTDVESEHYISVTLEIVYTLGKMDAYKEYAKPLSIKDRE